MKPKLLFTVAFVFFGSVRCLAQGETLESIFPKGKKIATNFTGTVWLQPLVAADTIFNLVAGSVTFEPGARSYWHTHDTGQILLVTDGTGWTQEKGKPVRTFKKGDVIICPPNTEHWHGATPTTSVTHVSLIVNANKGIVNWLVPVTEREYNGEDIKK